jgi:hypothetical protein
MEIRISDIWCECMGQDFRFAVDGRVVFGTKEEDRNNYTIKTMGGPVRE